MLKVSRGLALALLLGAGMFFPNQSMAATTALGDVGPVPDFPNSFLIADDGAGTNDEINFGVAAGTLLTDVFSINAVEDPDTDSIVFVSAKLYNVSDLGTALATAVIGGSNSPSTFTLTYVGLIVGELYRIVVETTGGGQAGAYGGPWSLRAVPLPGALPLLMGGLVGLGLLGWRRKVGVFAKP